MSINILYLYFDLMNLYGESGNIKAITYYLKNQDINVNIDRLSINEKIDINKYDLIYLSSSTDDSMKIVFNDIKKYKKDLQKYIEDGKFIISTGNSFALFGKNMLNIFDFETVKSDTRVVGDYITTYEKINVLAFQNRSTRIINNNYPFFDKEVGFNYKNFYGTYLIGPLLVRNPELNTLFMKKLIKSIDNKFKFKNVDFSLEKKAKEEYLKNYY